MKRKLQIYLMNPAEILRWDSEPSFVSNLSDKVDTYYVNQAGYLHLGEVEVEMPPVPHRDTLVVKTVEGMKAEVERIRAEAESKAREMEQQINDLLMIGHDRTEDFV